MREGEGIYAWLLLKFPHPPLITKVSAATMRHYCRKITQKGGGIKLTTQLIDRKVEI